MRAGDEERRRLERDLHDGAQQRLLGVGMGLQLLKSRVGDDAEASALLDETEARGAEARCTELRELARGIHPAVLTDQGLASAVRTLAERAPIPVEVRDSGERLPPHVETAAYFVVAEALANVVEARAGVAGVGHDRRRDGLRVRRGARRRDRRRRAEDGGSGLRGLADRVGALDGQLTVESPPGSGTRLRAEIPCGS